MLPSQYLILKLSYICIWKVSSLFNKGISSFYCIYIYFMYLFQNNFNSSTPTCFIYIRENDIFPYWAHLDVPQTLLELSNSQGKQWAEVWSHITNGQLMALLGQKYFCFFFKNIPRAWQRSVWISLQEQPKQAAKHASTHRNTARDFSSTVTKYSPYSSNHVHQMKIWANINTNPSIIKHCSFLMELFLFWSLSKVFIKRSVYFQT